MKKLISIILLLSFALLVFCSCESVEERAYRKKLETKQNTVIEAVYGTDDETETEPETEAEPAPETEGEPLTVDEYVGLWKTADGEKQVTIYEAGEDKLNVHVTIVRTLTGSGTAVKEGDEYLFGDGISDDYSGDAGVTGRIVLNGSGVTLTFDSFGESDASEEWDHTYELTARSDLP